MDIIEVREYALGLQGATEEIFAEQWLSFRIEGKWFLLMQLEAEEPRIAVKLPPDIGEELRERMPGVRPAYHMNKRHWNDLYLAQLPSDFVREQIYLSYRTVIAGLPKKLRIKYE